MTGRKLLCLNNSIDVSQRTYNAVRQTPDLPAFDNFDFKRSPVNQLDLHEFYNNTVRPDSLTIRSAVIKTAENFALPERVKMLHLKDLFCQDLEIWDKSSGLPWREIGYETKGDIKKEPEAIRRVRKFAHLVKNGENIHFPDCLVYATSHTCEGGEYKVETVWEYPATIAFMEAIFAVPLIRAYQASTFESKPIAYGFDTATGGMERLIKRFSKQEAFYIGLHFKKFDKTVPVWLIIDAFDIMMINMSFTYYEEYEKYGSGATDARRMILMWCTLQEYFVKTTIRTGDGKRYKKFSGIPSGSYFTELVGSIVNTIIINWLSFEQFGHYPLDVVALGDDSLISSTKRWDFVKCEELLNKIGMTLNMEKCEQNENLGRLKFCGNIIGSGTP
ncbi:hypothetical protein RN001_013583 [Aquatica leii]|uniref:RNA-directed RNA polymerase C-terminal domain-containing protein n=1 Tax=Aquatica leii TaxID=1421715 RepID=A0AAN7P308_9COLE|nr:hypothetical protein RN001_013583 [Aquatica leii]